MTRDTISAGKPIPGRVIGEDGADTRETQVTDTATGYDEPRGNDCLIFKSANVRKHPPPPFAVYVYQPASFQIADV